MQEIQRIDYIIDPFSHMVYRKTVGREITEKERRDTAMEWHKVVAEAVKEPGALVVIEFPDHWWRDGRIRDWLKKSYGKHVANATSKLVREAKEKLGKRLLISNKEDYEDISGKHFKNLRNALRANDFSFDPKKIQTEGMGELTLRCVFERTLKMNTQLGMPNPVPWKNAQTKILPKKSISENLGGSENLHYPSSAERKKFIKAIREGDDNAKAKLKEMMRAYTSEKSERGNYAIREVKRVLKLRGKRRV